MEAEHVESIREISSNKKRKIEETVEEDTIGSEIPKKIKLLDKEEYVQNLESHIVQIPNPPEGWYFLINFCKLI